MSSSKAPVDSKSPTTTAAPPLDIPPPYHAPTARCSSGLIDFAHLSTLTPEQLARFDEELVDKCRAWLTPTRYTVPMAELRDWLRSYGFFVSNDRSKYGQRAADPERPLGERLMAMVAFAQATPQGDGVMRRGAFWETLRELVEVRGWVGRV